MLRMGLRAGYDGQCYTLEIACLCDGSHGRAMWICELRRTLGLPRMYAFCRGEALRKRLKEYAEHPSVYCTGRILD